MKIFPATEVAMRPANPLDERTLRPFKYVKYWIPLVLSGSHPPWLGALVSGPPKIDLPPTVVDMKPGR